MLGKKKMGAHGVVKQVGVSSKSSESRLGAKLRTRKKSYAQRRQRRLSRRGLLIGAGVACVALLAAVGVGLAVYFATSDSKLALSESNASEALVEAEGGQPYYALCAAELGTAVNPTGPSTDAYLLVRIDEAARQLTFVAIPSNVTVWQSDNDATPLYDVRAQQGDAELVRQVAKLAEVDIAHFAYTTADGLRGMADAVGGVPMVLSQEVDDPRAGTIVMAKGEHTLTGDEALVFLRATNYADSLQAASRNRIDFTMALAERALGAPGLDFATLVGDLGNYVSTDYSASELIGLGDVLKPLDTLTVHRAVMEGHTSAASGYFVYSDERWAALMEAVRNGADPATVDASGDALNTAAVSVEIRNGAASTGMAAKLSEALVAEGYKVENVGNTDDGTIYPETLVIYKDEAYEGACKAILNEMGGGRIINGGDFYSFDTNVLVIIGRDWMPIE